jgi:hypothetical protein
MALVACALWLWAVADSRIGSAMPALAVQQASAAWPSPDEPLRLAQRVEAALPAGWRVAVAGRGGIPDGWQSTDTRTVQLNAGTGADAFRVWFVPADWIGIRRPDPKVPAMVYWEGVLADRNYKAIAPEGPFLPYERLDTVPAYAALDKMGMHPPSLINSGWSEGWAMFKDRIDDIDTLTQDLVRRSCASRGCEDEAARYR